MPSFVTASSSPVVEGGADATGGHEEGGEVSGSGGESTLGPGWAERWETGQGTGLPFTKMAGAVTPEGAEQLVAVVTEGERRMLMRLASSWAAKGLQGERWSVPPPPS